MPVQKFQNFDTAQRALWLPSGHKNIAAKINWKTGRSWLGPKKKPLSQFSQSVRTDGASVLPFVTCHTYWLWAS